MSDEAASGFTAAPLKGWPVRGFYSLLVNQWPVPGMVFNNEKFARWAAKELNALGLSAADLERLEALHVHALMARLSEQWQRQTASAEVTQLLSMLGMLGWNQIKLARKLQLDPNTVSRWITGRTPVPHFVLEYLSTLLSVKELVNRLDL